ncbi:DUF4296 domain-containing protein [Dyadobacter sandarakinus]|uniref:DUF4296 domain-containing protein n=2 Tax=Dyadobacter sandarakinus TaxID=2747268 RepID=A0ABX7IEX2_9BACT|nr:DUF4296 domain-containing protein [Dyadobacter sandarakinus]
MKRLLSHLRGLAALYALPALLLAGCGGDNTLPANTLSEEQMSNILADIHLAESRVNRLQLRSLDSSLMLFNRLKSDIWKKYKVDTLAYRESYNYYMTHPEVMTRIYEKVGKKIEQREKSSNIKL